MRRPESRPPTALAGGGSGMVRTGKPEQHSYSLTDLQEQRLARRFRLPPPTARAIAELAFGRCA